MKEFNLNADFGMTAETDEFVQYGIHAGDTVLFVKPHGFPAEGSLAAVSIDEGSALLKRITFCGDSLNCYLEGGSGLIPPIYISSAEINRLKVLGVAVSVIHSLTPVDE